MCNPIPLQVLPVLRVADIPEVEAFDNLAHPIPHGFSLSRVRILVSSCSPSLSQRAAPAGEGERGERLVLGRGG